MYWLVTVQECYLSEAQKHGIRWLLLLVEVISRIFWKNYSSLFSRITAKEEDGNSRRSSGFMVEKNRKYFQTCSCGAARDRRIRANIRQDIRVATRASRRLPENESGQQRADETESVCAHKWYFYFFVWRYEIMWQQQQQRNEDDDICSNNENNVSRSNSRNIRFQGLCNARTNDRMQLVPEEGFREFTAALSAV